MIDIPQGIPSQIIDLAEKNVEQARGAFLGFISAAQKATDAAETLPSSAKDAMDQGHVICRKQRQRSLRLGAEARPCQGRERGPRAAVRIRKGANGGDADAGEGAWRGCTGRYRLGYPKVIHGIFAGYRIPTTAGGSLSAVPHL